MPTQAPSKKWDWTLLRERWDKGLGWMRSHTEALFNETARLQRELDAARREADTSAKVAGKALTELHDKCSAPEPAAPASNRLSTEAIASLYNQLRPYPSESQVTECLKELLEWRAAGEPNEIERLERRVAELSMPWAQLAKKALTDDGVELDVFVARLWKRMEDQQRELAKLNARPAHEPREGYFTFAQISYALNRSLYAKTGNLAIDGIIEDLWAALNNGGDHPMRAAQPPKSEHGVRIPDMPAPACGSLVGEQPNHDRHGAIAPHGAIAAAFKMGRESAITDPPPPVEPDQQAMDRIFDSWFDSLPEPPRNYHQIFTAGYAAALLRAAQPPSADCQHDVTRSDHTIVHGEPPQCSGCDHVAQFTKWPAITGVREKVRQWLYDRCSELSPPAIDELESIIGGSTATKVVKP